MNKNKIILLISFVIFMVIMILFSMDFGSKTIAPYEKNKIEEK